ncbi:MULTISPECIES: hypothetical protein [unclassified Nostoc]|uniref:hypothetical protein n=1 Tax=unclassified Nostoc TaxID=2593658 RepID=UPI0028C44EFE|nr:MULTISPECIES: hypothetical protein [unclassified Nostoc]
MNINYKNYGIWVQKLSGAKGALALALITILLPGCGYGEPQAITPATQQQLKNQVSREVVDDEVEEVKDKTDQLIGKNVTIRTKPIRLIGPTSFTVRDEKLIEDKDILIINATGQPFTLPSTNEIPIQITGQVRRFDLAQVNQDYNLDLQPDYYRNYNNQPVIVAKSLALSPVPGELTTNPSQYYGKTLTVTGEVENINSPIAYTLDEDKLLGGEDLLVLHTQPQVKVTQGEKVTVTGVLRPMVIADLRRDYQLNWDANLQQQLQAKYRNKPVLVVQ